MRRLLKEISVIPGVTGSCIFDKKEGPLCKDLHPLLSEELLQTVGIHFLRLIQMGSLADLDIQSSHFRFDKYTVIGIPLDTGAVLLTICEAQANCSLVATTAAMLAADMKEQLDQGVTMIEDVESEDEVMAVDESDDEEMLALYNEIEQALAGAIGPVAGVVMQDYLEKWSQAGPVIPARLTELVEMLEKEIGDSELGKDFSKRLHSIL
ncbi:MAG: hypothetical protein L3J49_02155 [Desulfobulbaceae bacterium]|nr:hypothetical protein [Desulfobulbaceae bacterium]